jgi:hypothetical protein
VVAHSERVVLGPSGLAFAKVEKVADRPVRGDGGQRYLGKCGCIRPGLGLKMTMVHKALRKRFRLRDKCEVRKTNRMMVVFEN